VPPPPRPLRAYQGLPLEQYSLLDPRYISRMPPAVAAAEAGGGDDGGAGAHARSDAGEGAGAGPAGRAREPPASGSFLLTVPLADIVGLELTPQLVVDVDVDEARGQARGRAGARRARASWGAASLCLPDVLA
jgi:hypothetical protein